MPQLSHDAPEDGFHEIQLSGKQLVFLFIVTTMVSVTIFLFGVYVGRGAVAARQQESAADAPAADAVPAATSSAPPQVDAGTPPTDAPPDAEGDQLTYHKRLQGQGGADDGRAGAAAPKKSTPAPPDTASTRPQPASSRPEPVPPAKPQAAAPVAADVPMSGRPDGEWVVQVFASKDRAAAAALVQRLGAKGYPAFLSIPTSTKVPQFYRVQVGRYNERREAEQVRQRIAKEEQFKPWISR